MLYIIIKATQSSPKGIYPPIQPKDVKINLRNDVEWNTSKSKIEEQENSSNYLLQELLDTFSGQDSDIIKIFSEKEEKELAIKVNSLNLDELSKDKTNFKDDSPNDKKILENIEFLRFLLRVLSEKKTKEIKVFDLKNQTKLEKKANKLMNMIFLRLEEQLEDKSHKLLLKNLGFDENSEEGKLLIEKYQQDFINSHLAQTHSPFVNRVYPDIKKGKNLPTYREARNFYISNFLYKNTSEDDRVNRVNNLRGKEDFLNKISSDKDLYIIDPTKENISVASKELQKKIIVLENHMHHIQAMKVFGNDYSKRFEKELLTSENQTKTWEEKIKGTGKEGARIHISPIQEQIEQDKKRVGDKRKQEVMEKIEKIKKEKTRTFIFPLQEEIRKIKENQADLERPHENNKLRLKFMQEKLAQLKKPKIEGGKTATSKDGRLLWHNGVKIAHGRVRRHKAVTVIIGKKLPNGKYKEIFPIDTSLMEERLAPLISQIGEGKVGLYSEEGWNLYKERRHIQKELKSTFNFMQEDIDRLRSQIKEGKIKSQDGVFSYRDLMLIDDSTKLRGDLKLLFNYLRDNFLRPESIILHRYWPREVKNGKSIIQGLFQPSDVISSTEVDIQDLSSLISIEEENLTKLKKDNSIGIQELEEQIKKKNEEIETEQQEMLTSFKNGSYLQQEEDKIEQKKKELISLIKMDLKRKKELKMTDLKKLNQNQKIKIQEDEKKIAQNQQQLNSFIKKQQEIRKRQEEIDKKKEQLDNSIKKREDIKLDIKEIEKKKSDFQTSMLEAKKHQAKQREKQAQKLKELKELNKQKENKRKVLNELKKEFNELNKQKENKRKVLNELKKEFNELNKQKENKRKVLNELKELNELNKQKENKGKVLNELKQRENKRKVLNELKELNKQKENKEKVLNELKQREINKRGQLMKKLKDEFLEAQNKHSIEINGKLKELNNIQLKLKELRLEKSQRELEMQQLEIQQLEIQQLEIQALEEQKGKEKLYTEKIEKLNQQKKEQENRKVEQEERIKLLKQINEKKKEIVQESKQISKQKEVEVNNEQKKEVSKTKLKLVLIKNKKPEAKKKEKSLFNVENPQLKLDKKVDKKAIRQAIQSKIEKLVDKIEQGKDLQGISPSKLKKLKLELKKLKLDLEQNEKFKENLGTNLETILTPMNPTLNFIPKSLTKLIEYLVLIFRITEEKK